MLASTKDVEHQIIDTYKELESVHKTAKKVAVSMYAVYKALRDNGIDLKSHAYQKDKHKNSECFLDFSKEADSYFYGLLLADGNITTKDSGLNKIQISLIKGDEYILESLKEFFGSDNKISTRVITSDSGSKEYCHFCVGSITLHTRLVELGMSPRKSCKEKLPSFDWMHNKHFWRGVIDGDGSLFYMHGRPKIKLVGSKEVVEGFNEFCWKNCFTKKSSVAKDNACENVYYICFNGEDAIQIANVLYSDATLKLTRKFNKYLEFLQFFRDGLKKGVSLTKYGTYKASIKGDGVRLHLGSFKTYEEAILARLEAEVKYHNKYKEENVWQYHLSTLLNSKLGL